VGENFEGEKIMLEFLKIFWTNPTSPSGRKIRVVHLMKECEYGEDECQYIIYSRDSVKFNPHFNKEELEDIKRLYDLNEQRKLYFVPKSVVQK
jgi:hypothetical protein